MRVAVKKEVLEWAMIRSQRDEDFFYDRFPKLQQWLDGEIKPTFKNLEEFAKTTYLPTPFLLRDKPFDEHLPITDFRTIGDKAKTRYSPHLIDTIYDCQQKQDWYQEYCLRYGEDKNLFVGQHKISDDPFKVAKKIHAIFDLKQHFTSWSDAFSKRCEALEDKGILIISSGIVKGNTHRPLKVEEFRGFALYDDYAPLIFINAKDSIAARSFTLMHELAHLALGESGISNINIGDDAEINKIELWCNAVAAEVLVPQDVVGNKNYSQISEQTLNDLSQKYKVSSLVILRRLKDLALMSNDRYWEAFNLAKQRIDEELAARVNRSGGGNYYNSKPTAVSKRFLRALVISTLEGNTLYRDAMQIVNIKRRDTFNTLVQKTLESMR